MSADRSASAPLIVFDLDGTLIDTAHDLVDSLNHAVVQAGLEPVTYDDLTFLVGSGAKAMIERTFALRERALSEEELAFQMKEFVAHYHAHMPGVSRPYDGLIDALDRLEAEGYAFAVCTNKMEKLAKTLLSELKLDHRFKAITGGDSFDVRKPHAEHLLGTIRLAGGDPVRAVMVGDSLNDILAARNAKVPVIAVPFGYSDVPIATLDPDVIIQGFDELTVTLVEGLMAG
ncbi:HAD family hydrolase [Rhizobium rhizosphaerae]